MVLKHRKCSNHAGFLSTEKKKKKHKTESGGKRERERERGVQELRGDREGARVLRGGVEPERKRVVQRTILLVTKKYQLNTEMQLIIPRCAVNNILLLKPFPNKYRKKNKKRNEPKCFNIL